MSSTFAARSVGIAVLAILSILIFFRPLPAHADRPRDANVAAPTILPDRAPDTRECVTISEFRRIKIGMHRAEVEDILDGPGSRNGEHYRRYRMCYAPLTKAFLSTRYGSADRLWQALFFDFSHVHDRAARQSPSTKTSGSYSSDWLRIRCSTAGMGVRCAFRHPHAPRAVYTDVRRDGTSVVDGWDYYDATPTPGIVEFTGEVEILDGFTISCGRIQGSVRCEVDMSAAYDRYRFTTFTGGKWQRVEKWFAE